MAIVTISRGTFGGGKAVAEGLAAELGYNCVSREEIISEAAEIYGIPENNLRDSIIKPPGPLGINANNSITRVKYIRATLLNHCGDHKMVYHGHGGHLLLQNIPCLLRVKVIACIEYRIEHAMKNKGVTRDQALELIENLDKRRAHWGRSVWGVNFNDPSLFDLILNLDNITPSHAIAIIVRAIEQKPFQETDVDRQLFDDQLIVSTIWTELIKTSPTRFARIHLESNNKHVIVKGDVGSHKLASVITEVANTVDGVKEVTNKLTIGSNWMW